MKRELESDMVGAILLEYWPSRYILVDLMIFEQITTFSLLCYLHFLLLSPHPGAAPRGSFALLVPHLLFTHQRSKFLTASLVPWYNPRGPLLPPRLSPTSSQSPSSILLVLPSLQHTLHRQSLLDYLSRWDPGLCSLSWWPFKCSFL